MGRVQGPSEKTNGLLQLYKLGQGRERVRAGRWRWRRELADTLHKQLSIAGTVFPLWCFEVRNMDTVEASGSDGCWLKIISLSLCLLDFNVHGHARHASLKSRPSCQRPMGRCRTPVYKPHWLGFIAIRGK